jgi:cytochrome d ubiquinol oxidase subunit I
MQTPSGYELIEGRIFLSKLWAAVFNPSTLPRFFHTLDGALMTGAFFIMGISAYLILKNDHVLSLRSPSPLPSPSRGEGEGGGDNEIASSPELALSMSKDERRRVEGAPRNDSTIELARKSLSSALIVGFIASIIQLGLGHIHGIQVAFTQPEKLAAIEGVFETQQRAPALVFGIPNASEEKIDAAVRIPGLLSLLAFGKLDAEVKGLKDFPKDEWPPLALTFYPFHLMVAFGMLMIAFSTLGIFLLWRRRLFTNKMFLKLAVLLMPVPFIANELGWMTAEIGRQPWIVYHLMKTSDAISVSVPAGQILFTIICFSIIYILLFALWIFLIRREIIVDKQG